jgi:hypothetical protein
MVACLVVEVPRPVKTPLRTLLLVALGIPLLALLAWTGTFLYWHFRIRSAIRALEALSVAPTPPEGDPAAMLLMASGCRCLPYLVQAIDSSKSPEFLSFSTCLIGWETVSPG